MKLTSLIIQPTITYRDPGPTNPMRAVIKLATKDSAVECVLSDETMLKMLNLCADEIAENAARHVEEFRQAVTAIDGDKAAMLIGADE